MTHYEIGDIFSMLPPEELEKKEMALKAHDVRHLTICPACGNIGDSRTMIQMQDNRLLHGKCAFEELGLDGITKLPESEVGKFRLDEIGVEAMRILVNK